MSRTFLLFTLYAPMAAHGDVAVGERRMGWDRPGRSAVMGLLAAALGIERGDENALDELDRSLWFAVATAEPGVPMTDYHTIQVPRTPRKGRFATRRDELAAKSLSTILSVREWRMHVLHTVALWPRESATIDLGRLADALNRPHFSLYAGRRAGPIGWPPCARVVGAPTLVEALFMDRARKDILYDEYLGKREGGRLACDADAAGNVAPERSPDRIVIRRDQAAHHGRRQFAERREAVFDEWTVLE